MKNKLTLVLMIVAPVFIVTLLVSPSIFTSFQQASSILVGTNGQLKNKDAVYKEFVQGREFWEQQLRLINEKIDRPKTLKIKLDELKNSHERTNEILKKVHEQMDSAASEKLKSFTERPSYKMNKEAEKLKSESEFLGRVELLEELIKISESEIDELEQVKKQILMKLER